MTLPILQKVRATVTITVLAELQIVEARGSIFATTDVSGPIYNKPFIWSPRRNAQEGANEIVPCGHDPHSWNEHRLLCGR